MKNLLKCHDDHPDCFANCDGKCQLLESYIRDYTKEGIVVQSYGTKFKEECPFYKSVEQAGGTYEMLCERYPLPNDKPKTSLGVFT